MVTTRSKTGSLPETRVDESEPAAPPASKKKRTAPNAPTTQRKAPAVKRKTATKKPLSTNEPPQASPPVSAVSTKGTSTFLGLPAEIRNEIYELALVQHEPLAVLPSHPNIKEPALAAVNRQVRNEALSVWYGENTFLVQGSSPAVRFLRSLPDEKLCLLRTVRIATTMNMSISYAYERIKHFMKEFKPRGLSQEALRFESDPDQWASLGDLKRLLNTLPQVGWRPTSMTNSNAAAVTERVLTELEAMIM